MTTQLSAGEGLGGDVKNGGKFINMINDNEVQICPHCGKKMSKWTTPQLPFGGSTTWTSEFLHVCFNDECPYFVRGWDWIMESQKAKASYRHRLDPETGNSGPLPCWSHNAHKDRIIDE